MTTIVLLLILAYVWAAAVFIMYEYNARGWGGWNTDEWLLHAAYPLVIPVVLLVDLLEGPARRAVKKAKAIYRDAIDWLKGKYPL